MKAIEILNTWGIFFDKIKDIYKMHIIKDGLDYDYTGTLKECKEYQKYNVNQPINFIKDKL